MSDDILTPGEAADLLRVTVRQMRRWANDGKIEHLVLPSGRLRFRRQDIEALLVVVPTTESESAAGDAA